MSPEDEKRVIYIVGPTAVGKTRISLELAREVGGEIVSADSRYLYRGMDIGTAKPTLAERKIIQHHLVDVAQPDQPWSMAQFLKETKKIINGIHNRERIPILVGGTGQYYRALIEGWVVPEIQADDQLRTLLTEWGNRQGPIALHQKLTVLDPEASNQIDSSNLRRTVRAIEVILLTGQRFSSLRKKVLPDYSFWVIGLHRVRQDLYQRVDQRIDEMLSYGLINEVIGLKEKGYGKDLSSMSAIGYREILNFLDGQITLDEARMLMRKKTRNFIRRQSNWFKQTDPMIHWYDISMVSTPQIVNDLQVFLQR